MLALLALDVWDAVITSMLTDRHIRPGLPKRERAPTILVAKSQCFIVIELRFSPRALLETKSLFRPVIQLVVAYV